MHTCQFRSGPAPHKLNTSPAPHQGRQTDWFAPTHLVPRGELKGELRALLKGLDRPGWFSGDVAQQYLKARSFGWLAAECTPGMPPPEALCDPGPQAVLRTLSAFT